MYIVHINKHNLTLKREHFLYKTNQEITTFNLRLNMTYEITKLTIIDNIIHYSNIHYSQFFYSKVLTEACIIYPAALYLH